MVRRGGDRLLNLKEEYSRSTLPTLRVEGTKKSSELSNTNSTTSEEPDQDTCQAELELECQQKRRTPVDMTDLVTDSVRLRPKRQRTDLRRWFSPQNNRTDHAQQHPDRLGKKDDEDEATQHHVQAEDEATQHQSHVEDEATQHQVQVEDEATQH